MVKREVVIMSHNPKCPKCNSENWRCWDDRSEVFEDRETGDIHYLPVGYLACNECGAAWTDHDWHEWYEWLGSNDDEAFGREDYPDRI